MAKRNAREASATPLTSSTTAASAPAKAKSVATSSSSSSPLATNTLVSTATTVWEHYVKTTPQRTKLLDAFMAFLVVAGGLQFVYCVLISNFPYNAFLSGFSATVGQFVLTASLRIQTTDANKGDFPSVSPERAFADYVVCSLILHLFVINFIN